MAGISNQNSRYNGMHSPFSVDEPNRVAVTNAQGYVVASSVTYQELLTIVSGGGSLMGADNGLTVSGSIVKLGGLLITPTVIDFGSTTFSFANVPTGDASLDDLITIDGSGVIRKIDSSSLSVYALDANAIHKTGNEAGLTGKKTWTEGIYSAEVDKWGLYTYDNAGNGSIIRPWLIQSVAGANNVSLLGDNIRFIKGAVVRTIKPSPSATGTFTAYLPEASGTLALTSDLLTYTPNTRTLNINGNSYDLSANREWRVAQGDTGALSYGGISVVFATTVNIGACKGYELSFPTH